MNEKLYNTIIAVIMAAGVLSVIGMVAYTCYLYDKCSVISYIANGR